MLAGFLIMVPTDPARLPHPPKPVPIVRPAPKLKPRVTPNPKVIAPSPVLLMAQSMIGTSPSYSTEAGWCWHFVEDVLQRAHAGVSPIDGTTTETKHPVPGNIVYFFLPSRSGGTVGHVGIYESSDADWVYVINGNGSSSKLITRDRYPLAAVDIYAK